jgi:hypothetical protein
MTQKEKAQSKRNIKILVFILTLGSAFFIKWVNQL